MTNQEIVHDAFAKFSAVVDCLGLAVRIAGLIFGCILTSESYTAFVAEDYPRTAAAGVLALCGLAISAYTYLGKKPSQPS